MKFLDSKGRLFGIISILDLGAACVIVLVILGIFFFPGSIGGGIAGDSKTGTKQIEVDAIVRGLSIRDPQVLLTEFNESKKANIIIRNQPYGLVDILSVKQLPRTVVVPLADGSAKAIPDPRIDSYTSDMLLTLGGKAQVTKDGPVLGNNKVKIGIPIELEGFNYNFNATIIDLRIN